MPLYGKTSINQFQSDFWSPKVNDILFIAMVEGLEPFLERKNFTGGPPRPPKSLKIHIYRYPQKNLLFGKLPKNSNSKTRFFRGLMESHGFQRFWGFEIMKKQTL